MANTTPVFKVGDNVEQLIIMDGVEIMALATVKSYTVDGNGDVGYNTQLARFGDDIEHDVSKDELRYPKDDMDVRDYIHIDQNTIARHTDFKEGAIFEDYYTCKPYVLYRAILQTELFWYPLGRVHEEQRQWLCDFASESDEEALKDPDYEEASGAPISRKRKARHEPVSRKRKAAPESDGLGSSSGAASSSSANVIEVDEDGGGDDDSASSESSYDMNEHEKLVCAIAILLDPNIDWGVMAHAFALGKAVED